MILKNIKYSEYEDRPNSWFLENIELEMINLLVGKNASGKSRTVNVIAGLSNLLSGSQAELFDSGNYIAEFVEGDSKYVYKLELANKNVLSETLIIDDIEYLSRSSDGHCKIKAIELKSLMNIKVPANQIVAVIRRDEIQHPYLEKLFIWASSVQHYQFGTSLGRESGIIFDDPKQISVNLRDNNQVTGMLMKAIQEFDQEFIDEIIGDMRTIGYDLSEVGACPNPNFSILAPGGMAIHLIYVKEVDRDSKTFQNEMSQGMFRALSLVIQLNFCQRVKRPSTILIDDIGEGLDFDRSAHLISLLTHKSEDNQFQILMSTNDKFVMNNVALKYWQVIKRINNVCKVFNYRNSKNIFEDFEFTGLSNFDFFTSEFYEQGFEKE